MEFLAVLMEVAAQSMALLRGATANGVGPGQNDVGSAA